MTLGLCVPQGRRQKRFQQLPLLCGRGTMRKEVCNPLAQGAFGGPPASQGSDEPTSLRPRVVCLESFNSEHRRCAGAAFSLVPGPWDCPVIKWVSSVRPRISPLTWVTLSAGRLCFWRATSLFSRSQMLRRKRSCLTRRRMIR